MRVDSKNIFIKIFYRDIKVFEKPILKRLSHNLRFHIFLTAYTSLETVVLTCFWVELMRSVNR